MNQLTPLLVLVCVGCVSQPVVRPPLVAANQRPEVRELPLDPREEALPDGVPTTPGESAVEPIEEAMPAPMAGILISESRAARDVRLRPYPDPITGSLDLFPNLIPRSFNYIHCPSP